MYIYKFMYIYTFTRLFRSFIRVKKFFVVPQPARNRGINQVVRSKPSTVALYQLSLRRWRKQQVLIC